MKTKQWAGLPRDEITPYVAVNLRRLMKRESINTAMLADFCQVPRTTLDNVLAVPPNIQTTTCLRKIAEVMRTSVEWLQGEHDE